MRNLFCILFILTFYSCSNNASTENEQPNSETLIFHLPDSLFPFKDIKSSLVVDKFWYDPDHSYKAYTDSVSRIPFIHLDSAQKLRLIVPLMTSEIKTDTNYITHYMDAVFVSKQKNIGEFTPIIVWVSGDDYGGLFYILLDKAVNPISYFRLNGGYEGGPSEGPDSTLELPPRRHSFLNGDEISTYSLTEFIKPDSIKRPSIFDSINYISKILASGQIETKQLDSTRFERLSDW